MESLLNWSRNAPITLLLGMLCVAAAPLPAQQAGAALGQAGELFRQGKVAEAEAALRRLAKTTPEDPAVWNLLGAALDTRQSYGEAEKCFREALRLAPNSPAILNNLGNHYIEAKNPREALTAFQKVVSIDPDHQNANLQMARLSVERQQGREALGYLARLTSQGREPPAVRLLRARALYQSGRSGEADIVFADLEKTAAGPAVWYSLGLALGEATEYARAEEAFSRALEAAPGNIDILHNLGLAALRAEHAERAQQVFEAILRAKPDDVEAAFQLGRAIAQQGRFDEAILVLARARKMAPERADILRTLATTEAQAGFFGDAALALDDYLKLRPDDDVARRERGFAYSCAGNKAEALPDLEWYVKRYPKDPVGHFQLGFGLSVSDREAAFRQLNEAIRLKPDFPEAHLMRGSLYQNAGKPAEALADLEIAVSRRPDHIRAISLLGRVYLELERPEDAVRVLREGYKLAPKDSQILMTLGRALIDTGEQEEGARLLEEFASVGPDRSAERAIPGRLSLLNLPPDQLKERYEENLRSALRSRGSDAEIRALLARFLLANGRRDEAVSHYREILNGPTAPHVLLDCGHTLIEAGEYALAREFIENALAADPRPGAKLDLVVTLLGLEDPQAALRELDGIPEQQRQGDYYLLRAQVFDALGKIPEAAASLNLGFQKAPTRADLYEKAAHFLLEHGMDGEALNLLEQAAKLLPDEPNLLLLQAALLGITNRTDEALAQLHRVTARWPEWSRPYLVRGIIEENHARGEEALKSVRTAMAMGERGAEAYYYLAESLSSVAPGNLRAARQAIGKAIELAPSDPWAHALAGRLAWQMEDFESSVSELQQALRLKDDFVRAHFWLGATYRSMGKDTEADAELAEVESIHDRNPQAEAETGPGVRARLFRAVR